jgi:uncharacterized membrane protein
MNKLIPVGRTFFAVALIGLGIDHFVFRDFVAGRAPAWPESIPGRLVWAYLTGIVFVVIGIAVLADKMARSTAIFGGALIFLLGPPSSHTRSRHKLISFRKLDGCGQGVVACWWVSGHRCHLSQSEERL